MNHWAPPAFTPHRGETFTVTGGPSVQDYEAPSVPPLPDGATAPERTAGIGLTPSRAPHLGTSSGDSWRLYPCTSGWALTFQSWPSDAELETLCAVLSQRADRIHRCDIELPENLPSANYLASLLSEVLANLGDVPIAVWHKNRILHRYNGYQKYDPLRPRRGCLSTIY